jgi:plastocyanin
MTGRGRDHNANALWSATPSVAFVYVTGSGTFQFSPASITVKVGPTVV